MNRPRNRRRHNGRRSAYIEQGWYKTTLRLAFEKVGIQPGGYYYHILRVNRLTRELATA